MGSEAKRPMRCFAVDDEYLSPYLDAINARMNYFESTKAKVEAYEGSLEAFSQGWRKFGLIREDGGVRYREWAPSARALSLVGDFCNWDRRAWVCERNEFAIWTCFIPDDEAGMCRIPHGSKVKASVTLESGEVVDRIPAWIRRVTQSKDNPAFDGIFWNPSVPYEFKNPHPPRPTSPRIYESHVGMSSKDPKISTYVEFERDILPRIRDLGYNCVQLMAIMEHPYYASFGYQVSMPFAVSSRFGTPEELMSLVDAAHGMGLFVLLDVVHSHSTKNVLDGLNEWDGSDSHYFHSGDRGTHSVWDSRLFDYGKWEVLRYLLSNLHFYSTVFRFDGFRFDGVTSMLYTHHGLGAAGAFDSGYDQYFSGVDGDALRYLSLANEMLHDLRPSMITIAEDVSGMPGLARRVEEGGLGFDYRLGMSIPDLWQKLLSKTKDEDWKMGHLAFSLLNRRYREKTIAYVESHDQALVGDKTVAFWLMDSEMYWHMSGTQKTTPIISRGLALHKMIRMITLAMGGEGYLNFMGNEFGHPEWVDFPREGNGDSMHYARRRWDLVDDPLLRYRFLNEFDRAMMRLESTHSLLSTEDNYVSRKHDGDKVLVFEKGSCVFVFNFHPSESWSDYGIPIRKAGKYALILSSDDVQFGGEGRVDSDVPYFTSNCAVDGFESMLMIYVPSRTALVFCLDE